MTTDLKRSSLCNIADSKHKDKEALTLFLHSENWGIGRILQRVKVDAHASAWAFTRVLQQKVIPNTGRVHRRSYQSTFFIAFMQLWTIIKQAFQQQ